MGSDNDAGDADESPVHTVILSPFCLARKEATVGEFAQCTRAGSCPPLPREVTYGGISDVSRTLWSLFCNAALTDRDQHPANCLDWAMAEQFCAWRGGRLPTEAEWEFAARGPSLRTMPWGEEPIDPRLGNFCGLECAEMLRRLGQNWRTTYPGNDRWTTTAPVGSFPAGASPFRILDMAGNVWEWVADRYGPYSTDAVRDPRGAERGQTRVNRGGSWDAAFLPRSANRFHERPDARRANLGVRCAADPRH